MIAVCDKIWEWTLRLVIILIGIFQITVIFASATPIIIEQSHHAGISKVYAYDEIESSAWIEGDRSGRMNWAVSKSEVGSECKSLLLTGSNAAKTGGRVFWSGGDDAMNAAMNYAKANGMTTLEMTRAGQNLTKLTQGMPWEQAGPMWQRLSAAYAKGANGSVHVFQNANTGVRLNSVWRTVEYPILNGKNNIIYHNVFKP